VLPDVNMLETRVPGFQIDLFHFQAVESTSDCPSHLLFAEKAKCMSRSHDAMDDPTQ
jgi:hypothetical protein